MLAWYAEHARDLPWRRPGPPEKRAWPVLVSEVMLQQTPVARVEPVWRAWLHRWPEPAALAAEPAGEAVRAWGRLGYPRRALRLHAAAGAVVERHGGRVPSDQAELRALPGVGAYTAAAVGAFAFDQRVAVVDTNVRRVLARTVQGKAQPAPALTAAETALAVAVLPEAPSDDPVLPARWSVAVMELGALVCTARAPRCGACPVVDLCAWQRAGAPPDDGPARRGQAWHGTDRQVRGRLLALLREAPGPLDAAALSVAWDDDAQRERCLASLVTDGLVVPAEGGWALPG
ncbi:A/G-specific DNA-adenine glycosylase [Quadrisphaera granulorum]|uniref:Adenine DNA glycosylase n=1 Tax=Quadrisphaera granulorum TaxID=317664 RepID=A0A316A8V7_9ACTN|nr:A/G-specific DNA-adenine glycosylase [Quadrisphaera granulorum]SZE96958.1 A/G-specific DNA-adenine glycosylase [Quadrisphaera granulorum]